MSESPVFNNTTLGKEPQPLIVALYARVSTGRQEQEATIESQLDETKTRIKTDGNILSPENTFIDDGWSGELFERPALDQMRDAALAGAFQVLYVYDLGRLSRDFTNQLVLLRELGEEVGIQVISLHDVNGQSSEDQFIRGIMGLFHDFERKKIAERFRRGKLYKAKNGIMINGQALYGYSYIKKTKTTPTRYEINEEEAEVVKRMFYWVGIERISLREVIKRLYELGIPTKKRKSEFWTKGPIVRILRCESYILGEVYYNKYEAIESKNRIKNEKYHKVKKNSRRIRPREEWIPFMVPVILKDRSLFEKVQKILEYNQKYARKNRKYDYLVSDRVFCQCGNKRVGDGSSLGGHFYYRCAERVYKFPLPHKCKAKGVNAVVLDTMLWKELVKVITNPLLLKSQAEKWLSIQNDNDHGIQEKQRLEVAIVKVDDEEKRYTKAYGSGDLEFEQFRELIKGTKKRRKALEVQLNEIEGMMSREVVSIEAHELLEEAKRVLKVIDPNNKIQVVRDIIDKVVIKERSMVQVWAHLPLSDLKLGHESQSRDSGASKCGEEYTF